MKKISKSLIMLFAFISIFSCFTIQSTYAKSSDSNSSKIENKSSSLKKVISTGINKNAVLLSTTSATQENFKILGYSYPEIFDTNYNYYEPSYLTSTYPNPTPVPGSTVYIIVKRSALSSVYGVTMEGTTSLKCVKSLSDVDANRRVVNWYDVYSATNVSKGNHWFEVTGNWNCDAPGVDRDRMVKFDRIGVTVNY